MNRVSSPTIVHARRYDTGEPVEVTLTGERVTQIEPAVPTGAVNDWPWIAPGLFDLQINGYGGTWFSDEQLTVGSATKAIHAYAQAGVTRLCPTLVTNSFEALHHGFCVLKAACDADSRTNHMVAGFHLEGPYISPEDGPRGAHPRAHVRPARWEEFERLQDAAGGRIILVTLAPEVDGAMEFIRRASQAGIVIAIGHTAASAAQIREAIDAGARLGTHLGNGSAAMIHRHVNHIYAQLADDRLAISIIADGHHVPDDLLKIFVRTKPAAKIILTCDAAGWAGCPAGIYESSFARSEILPNGKLVVAGQTELLAGSADTTDKCVRQIQLSTGVSRTRAIDMASLHPAELFRCEPGRLRRGGLADFFLFRQPAGPESLQVVATICRGEVTFGQLSEAGAIR